MPVSARKILAVGALLLAGACKQGLGDRCQIDGDCESTFVCSLADHTCREPVAAGSLDAGGEPDAPAPPDGSLLPDAPVPDAPPLPPDASPIADSTSAD